MLFSVDMPLRQLERKFRVIENGRCAIRNPETALVVVYH